MRQIFEYITAHWAVFLTLCGTVGSIVYLILDARYARKVEIKEGLDYLNLKFDEVENRVDKVEQELQHLPSAKDLMGLQAAIKEMRGETYALRSSIKGLSRLVDLLVEKEVNKGDK
ncbi:DUF2730 family protein [Psychrobacter sp. FDAARGOS_221]|uniref:DUF2730 family protein n=1 Tax=Psychrobacter sp. FDAARGOS_221 TaxID=1975705 RepID=UPI00187D137C|nr:DUF2730 family protein [Psychrobacter sp. FDAARGOS_221]